MTTVEIQNITKLYGTQKALDDVSLKIGKGEVLGLLGPNGAGKSTLMKILTSFISPTSGKALINGLDVQEQSIEIRKNVGYLPENNPLYLDMYIKEYLAFVVKMYNNTNNTKQAVAKMIELTGLGPEQNKLIGELSKGYRQRVGLAQALIHNPDILILDEPTSGLDPNQLVDIRNIISELGKSKTIILSTHIMQEVEAVCDRVVIIDKGKIVADDTAKNLSKLSGTGLRFRVEFKELININLLKKLSFINKVEKISGKEWLLESKDNKDIREEIFKFAVSKQLNVLSLSQSEQNMEDIFHKLTKQ